MSVSEANGAGVEQHGGAGDLAAERVPERGARGAPTAGRAWASTSCANSRLRVRRFVVAGPRDSYCPRPSTATVRYPASASGSCSAMKSSLLPVNPGSSRAVPRSGRPPARRARRTPRAR